MKFLKYSFSKSIYLNTLRLMIYFDLAAIFPQLVSAGNPVSNASSTVQRGNVRITVLSPQILRMEWNKDLKFED
jgi:hypothetical protein